ncbi:MAG: SMC-Scp complex subunit ScpB [bacterium]
MVQTNLDNIIIALLFASDEPLSVRKMSAVLDDIPIEDIRDAVGRVETRFGGEDSVIQLEQVAGGYQLSTNTAYAEYIARLYRGRRKQRLSKAAMETLAIIAYKQPVTRADIENLRGVGCGGVITTLMERSLIRIVGKAKVLGSPFLYGTTQEFLEYLGLNHIRDLPSMEDLEALLEQEAAGEGLFEPAEPPRGEATDEDSDGGDEAGGDVPADSDGRTARDASDEVTRPGDEDADGGEDAQLPAERTDGDAGGEEGPAETYRIDDREDK